MAKILHYEYLWFQEVAPRSYYNEGDLERTILHNLAIIFPDFTALPFKIKLYDPDRDLHKAADLVMIKNDYSEWHVIEVELGGHPVDHVIDQISTFHSCSYTDVHAKYIYEKSNKKLNLSSLTSMIAVKTPELMVIVNEPKPDWESDLKTFGCKACIFQIYQNYDGITLYRLEGEHPIIKTDFCHCKYQNTLPYVVQVLDKKFLDAYNIFDGSVFDIEFRGKLFSWERFDSGNSVFLKCNNPTPPLDPISDRYRLNSAISTSIVKKNQAQKWLSKIFPKYFAQFTVHPTFSFIKD